MKPETPERTIVKNHPMDEALGEAAVAVRRLMPWQKGEALETVQIKNHPQTTESDD